MLSFLKKNNTNKIFCISFQRTGTTSVGSFFKEMGYKVQGYDPKISGFWSYYYDLGNYEKIFNDSRFKKNQVFEDGPWWVDGFYKFLYHRFPDAKFILFTRDSDKWFDSMVSHSYGKTLGNTYRHSKYYNRQTEYNLEFPEKVFEKDVIDNLLPLNESHREHYKNIYNNRNKEIVDFFNHLDSNRLIKLELEDEDKWIKLGKFFDIKIENNYSIHANKSADRK